MNIRQWLQFIVMAIVWGSVTHVAAHYALVGMNTYRARQAEVWFERRVRMYLQ